MLSIVIFTVKILVFGNALADFDSMPLRLLPALRSSFPSIEFKEFDTAEDLEGEGRDLVMLDTVAGIRDVTVFYGPDDICRFADSPRFSVHDFDLTAYLKLLRKAGMLDSVKIIGIPQSAGYEAALSGTVNAIRSITG